MEFPVEFPQKVPQRLNLGISIGNSTESKLWNFVLTALLILKCNYVCCNSFIITNLPTSYSIIDNEIKSANTIEQLNSRVTKRLFLIIV